MWTNPLYLPRDARALARRVVESQPLATVVAESPLRIAHMPVMWSDGDSDDVIVGHMPLADPVAAAIRAGETLTLVFTGPAAYVTPSWYGSSGLPTYNYVPVHIRGKVRALGRDATREHLVELMTAREAAAAASAASEGWRLDDDGRQRMERLLPAVVGFALPVEELDIKAKLGQNRPDEDRDTVLAGLRARDRGDDREVAAHMERETSAPCPADDGVDGAGGTSHERNGDE